MAARSNSRRDATSERESCRTRYSQDYLAPSLSPWASLLRPGPSTPEPQRLVPPRVVPPAVPPLLLLRPRQRPRLRALDVYMKLHTRAHLRGEKIPLALRGRRRGGWLSFSLSLSLDVKLRGTVRTDETAKARRRESSNLLAVSSSCSRPFSLCCVERRRGSQKSSAENSSGHKFYGDFFVAFITRGIFDLFGQMGRFVARTTSKKKASQ